ncbi:MAG: hypothetical protein B6A08_12450 [Sorangiineae bacterium NIC37A_2]|jgi:hypothetical protein|nr:MAG: hypothetical protein B6A08_12450 [Sorangiineae bacterium NIC37A_2]
MRKLSRYAPVLAALLGAVTFVAPREAKALRTTPKGSMALAAERLTGLSLTFPQQGDVFFSTHLLTAYNFAPGQTFQQNPRIGFDYFVIDGLSLGGSAGLGYNGRNEAVEWSVLPRVGYRFGLSATWDFWPRLGVGIYGIGGTGNNFTTGVISLESPFVWKVHPAIGVELTPALDIGLASGAPIALGGTVGVVHTW